MSRERLRDPIHGLIVFDTDNPVDDTDNIAWKLIQTPEFQRLRRIKQLGVSELTFPGATHSRFIHSIGVYHNARRLLEVVRRLLSERGEEFNTIIARNVLLGTLLHDIGHGPFSHAFENARKALSPDPNIRDHEWFTGKMIKDREGAIFSILGEEKAEQVAALFEPDDPENIYQSILTSSFDADRLDYLARDRYMTGVRTGAIDTDWLLDNLSIHYLKSSQDGEIYEDSALIPTFSFKEKGRQAAEDFLLARYRLFSQVYLHKTTRGFECILSALIKKIAIAAREKKSASIGIDGNHPLVRFLSNEQGLLDDYRRLDDSIAWSAIEILTSSPNALISTLANRVWNRERLRCLDVQARYLQPRQLMNADVILKSTFEAKLGDTVFRDAPSHNLYSSMDGDATKAHKIVRINDRNADAIEITKFGDTVIGKTLQSDKRVLRYFFLDDNDFETAQKKLEQGG